MRPYLLTAVLVLAAFVARLLLDPLLQGRSPFLLFTLAVLAAAARYGPRSGILATLLSAALGTWAFLPPRRSFGPFALDEWANLVAFVITSFAIILLARKLLEARSRRWKARSRAGTWKSASSS